MVTRNLPVASSVPSLGLIHDDGPRSSLKSRWQRWPAPSRSLARNIDPTAVLWPFPWQQPRILAHGCGPSSRSAAAQTAPPLSLRRRPQRRLRGRPEVLSAVVTPQTSRALVKWQQTTAGSASSNMAAVPLSSQQPRPRERRLGGPGSVEQRRRHGPPGTHPAAFPQQLRTCGLIHDDDIRGRGSPAADEDAASPWGPG